MCETSVQSCDTKVTIQNTGVKVKKIEVLISTFSVLG